MPAKRSLRHSHRRTDLGRVKWLILVRLDHLLEPPLAPQGLPRAEREARRGGRVAQETVTYLGSVEAQRGDWTRDEQFRREHQPQDGHDHEPDGSAQNVVV